MATYNGCSFLPEQLDSIITQTSPPYELIIVDDCSSDETRSIIKKYQDKHPFIHLHKNETNTGVTRAFEKAISLCTGDYIALSDQDDIWEPDKLEILLAASGSEDAVYSNSLLVDENGNSSGIEFKSLMKLQSYYTGEPFLMGNCIPGHSILMKTDFARIITPFPNKIMHDRWIGFCAAGGNGIRYIDKPLVKYRQHDSNTIGTGRSNQKKTKLTSAEKFQVKFIELKEMQTAPLKNDQTRRVLQDMIDHFTPGWSLKRCLFFFGHIDTLLVIKNKPRYRKMLYCLKMFFRPNY